MQSLFDLKGESFVIGLFGHRYQFTGKVSGKENKEVSSWVEVTAETHTDINTPRAGEGHHVIKRATAKRQKKKGGPQPLVM